MKFLYFLKVDITVKPKMMEQFIFRTELLLQKIQVDRGWKLIAALSGVTTVPNTVVHLWQMPSANSLLETMDYLASDPLQEYYLPILDCCEKQVQEIYTAMPYNPLGNNEGGGNSLKKKHAVSTI